MPMRSVDLISHGEREHLFTFLILTVLALSISAPAQTRIKLSAIKPGTEQVQLIPNGDFQFQGPLAGGSYPNPTGWSRSGDMFATGGSKRATSSYSDRIRERR